jgi:hypothetical protein
MEGLGTLEKFNDLIGNLLFAAEHPSVPKYCGII